MHRVGRNMVCGVPGCGRTDRIVRGFCDRHYQQLSKKHLDPMGTATRNDPNEIVCREGYAELICRKKEGGEESGRILVSQGDLRLVLWAKWHVATNGYAATTVITGGSKKLVLMHRYILGLSDDAGLRRTHEVDHVNHNRLDNRRENLRVVTQQENLWNRGLVKPNGLRLGVTKMKDNQKYTHRPWKAALSYGDNVKYAFFATYEEAVAQREAWEKERLASLDRKASER